MKLSLKVVREISIYKLQFCVLLMTSSKILYLGAFGMVALNLFNALIEEKLMTGSFSHTDTKINSQFTSELFLIFFPALVVSTLGTIVTRVRGTNKLMPYKNILWVPILQLTAQFSIIQAAQMTSYPMMMVGRSSKLLLVILYALLFTSVQSEKSKLNVNKIWSGVVMTIGIFLFFYYSEQEHKEVETSKLGIFFMISCVAMETIIPDIRAKVIENYRPNPVQMMTQFNIVTTCLSLAILIARGELLPSLEFMIHHFEFTFCLICYSLMIFVDQVLLYFLVNNLKQHITPFLGTLRRMLTIFLSIYVYQHAVNRLQVLGLLTVLFTTIFQVISEITALNKPKKIEQTKKTK